MKTTVPAVQTTALAGAQSPQDAPTLDEVIPGIGEDIEIDPAILEALPQRCTFTRATAYGASLWTRTARIITRLVDDGSERCFFLKTATGELGRKMFHGEFEGMAAIHRTTPTFAPRPIAWGECRNATGTYFFVSEFVDMADGELPDAAEFCARLAELHRNSVSPTGKFGFHVVTCNGNIPQNNDWKASWEEFFADGLRHMMELDVKVNGTQPELVDAMGPVFEHVIPRLLRPLERGPSPIRPALVHGDLWYGNSSTDLNTDLPVVFDSAAFYAHNEYELGNWRPIRNRFNKGYFRAYAKHYPIAHPEAEFDDRIMLYELRFNFHLCIMFPGSVAAKQEMISNMRYLADKYPSVNDDMEPRN